MGLPGGKRAGGGRGDGHTPSPLPPAAHMPSTCRPAVSRFITTPKYDEPRPQGRNHPQNYAAQGAEPIRAM